LVSGSPALHFYNVGDAVILANANATQNDNFINQPLGNAPTMAPENNQDTYHMGIIIRGGNDLDTILIAQLSYSAPGFYLSGSPDKNNYQGRFQVITLRTYLSQDSAGLGNPVPALTDSNYAKDFDNLAHDKILHGIPQQ
jgi:hypothetical protein